MPGLYPILHSGEANMEPQPNVICNVIRNAFVTAILLTGNAERAEAAVLDAIGSCSPDEQLEGSLLQATIRASIGAGPETFPEGMDDLTSSISLLPPELHGVLRLSPWPRRCYVLRILAAVPRKVCAGMLRLNPAEVDRHISAALLSLSNSLATGA
jgi:hypothetical protein